MKKIFCFLIILCVLFIHNAVADTTIKETISIDFKDVSREGLYSGEINESGKPDGFGVFEATNSQGIRYIIVGEWIDGKQTGEAWIAWDDGIQQIGEFENGELIKGIYISNATKQQYEKASQTQQGYTPDNLIKVDWKSLDDASIIALLTNVFGEPLNQDGVSGYVWLATGFKFCDLDMVAVYASVDEKGQIKDVSYMMTNTKYSSISSLYDDMQKDFTVIDLLIKRVSAKVGRTGDMMIDYKVMNKTDFDETIQAMLQLNNITNSQVVFAYSWGSDFGIVYSATKSNGSILFTMQKNN